MHIPLVFLFQSSFLSAGTSILAYRGYKPPKGF